MTYKSTEMVSTPQWTWSLDSTETTTSTDRLTITDSGQGKAWTSSIVTEMPLPKTSSNYYEIKVESCNASNSIKIVFGLMDSIYLSQLLKISKGAMGSLRGGCPFGYFKEFGAGTLCYFANGVIAKDGIPVQKVESFTTNDRIGLLYDQVGNSIAFFKNKGLQYTMPNSFGNELYLAASLIKQNSISIQQNPETPVYNQAMQPLPTTTTPQAQAQQQNNDASTNPPVINSNNVNSSNNTKPVSNSPPPTINSSNHNNSNHNNIESNNKNSGEATTTTTTTTSTSLSPKPLPHVPSNNNTVLPPPAETNNNISTSTNNNTASNDNLCPICNIPLRMFGTDLAILNQHIDECLTLNLLDNEHGQGGVKPKKVECPYTNCKKSMTSSDFVAHCSEKHFLADHHEYICPLCKEKSKNLISHLSKSHMTPSPQQKKQSFIGAGYSVSTLDHDLDSSNECAICLEEFLKGQSVARLECLCIFHIQCIEFFLKTKKCPVHH